MPNTTPGQSESPFCGDGTCVQVTEHAEGIDFTSTLGADKGRVTCTRDEVSQFLGDVKAGHSDRLILGATV